jgi:hypothetical protein
MRAREIREYLDSRNEADRLVCVLHIAGYSARYIAKIVRKPPRPVGKAIAWYADLFGKE